MPRESRVIATPSLFCPAASFDIYESTLAFYTGIVYVIPRTSVRVVVIVIRSDVREKRRDRTNAVSGEW